MFIMLQNRQNALSQNSSCRKRRLLFHVMENTLLLSQSSEFKPSKTTDKCFFSTLVLNRSFILNRYSS